MRQRATRMLGMSAGRLTKLFFDINAALGQASSTYAGTYIASGNTINHKLFKLTGSDEKVAASWTLLSPTSSYSSIYDVSGGGQFILVGRNNYKHPSVLVNSGDSGYFTASEILIGPSGSVINNRGVSAYFGGGMTAIAASNVAGFYTNNSLTSSSLMAAIGPKGSGTNGYKMLNSVAPLASALLFTLSGYATTTSQQLTPSGANVTRLNQVQDISALFNGANMVVKDTKSAYFKTGSAFFNFVSLADSTTSATFWIVTTDNSLFVGVQVTASISNSVISLVATGLVKTISYTNVNQISGANFDTSGTSSALATGDTSAGYGLKNVVFTSFTND